MDTGLYTFGQVRRLKPVLLRALNNNQVLVLSKVHSNQFSSITKTLTKISDEFDILLSTLKLNTKALREMGLLHELFFGVRFLNGKGKPHGMENYVRAVKGGLIALDGKRKIFAKESFYPIFLGERGYKNTLCMKAKKATM